MKNMIIIGTMMLVSLSGCDDVINAVDNGVVEFQKVTDAVDNGIAELQKVTTKGWKYSTKVDKISLEHSASATREFTDKDVDFVRIDVDLTCTNNESLYATITTYDTRPDKDGNMSGASMSYDPNSDEADIIETRSGKNKIRYLISMPKYSNELEFDVAHPDMEYKKNPEMKYILSLGIDPLRQHHLIEKSASKMVDNQWVIRVNTELGNPTIVVDLNDPTVKKVTSQCKWNPAFSTSAHTESKNTSNVTEETQKGYIQTKATFLGYGEADWGCTSNFILDGKKVDVEGCPKNKTIYENNRGNKLTLKYKTGMVEGFKTYYFVDVKE